jgi:hypothetical protein
MNHILPPVTNRLNSNPPSALLVIQRAVTPVRKPSAFDVGKKNSQVPHPHPSRVCARGRGHYHQHIDGIGNIVRQRAGRLGRIFQT